MDNQTTATSATIAATARFRLDQDPTRVVFPASEGRAERQVVELYGRTADGSRIVRANISISAWDWAARNSTPFMTIVATGVIEAAPEYETRSGTPVHSFHASEWAVPTPNDPTLRGGLPTAAQLGVRIAEKKAKAETAPTAPAATGGNLLDQAVGVAPEQTQGEPAERAA